MPTLFTMNADVQDFMSPAFRGAAGTQIHFDLNITPGALLKVDDLERPTMALYHRAVGYIRSDGRMYDREPVSAAPYDLEDPGTLGVRLLADDPDLNLSGPVTYRVSGFRYLDGRKVGFGPYETTAVPSTDVVVDLADFLVPPADLVANTSDALIRDAVESMTAEVIDDAVAAEVSETVPAAVNADISGRSVSVVSAGNGLQQITIGGASGPPFDPLVIATPTVIDGGTPSYTSAHIIDGGTP